MNEKTLKKVFELFDTVYEFKSAKRWGNGNVNKTYLVKTTDEDSSFILQRINTEVFSQPTKLFTNAIKVTEHLKCKKVKTLEYVREDSISVVNHEGLWRMFRYVNNSIAYDKVSSPEQFGKVGKAFGEYVKKLSTLSPLELEITIPHFHDVEKRFQDFLLTILKSENKEKLAKLKAKDKKIWETVIKDREKYLVMSYFIKRNMPYRIVHNDTKLNNILFDKETDEILCVIDLDTTMPGSLLYDFGDAIRYGAATAEENAFKADIDIDLELFEAFTREYLKAVKGIITQNELLFLVDSVLMITFELGLRFLTDYFKDGEYFNMKPKVLLKRARVQFKLLEKLELKYKDMKNIVHTISKDLGI